METADETKKDEGVPEQKKHVSRSFETDMASEIREHQGSVVQIAIAENEKKEQMKERMSIRSKKNIFFLSSGILLFIVAFIFIFLFSKKTDAPIVNTPTQSNQLITADEETYIDISDLSKIKITNKIAEIGQAPNTGTIKSITLAEKSPAGLQKITVQRFFTAMETGANEKLLASLSGNFMLGSYACTQEACISEQQFFLIAEVADQNSAFAGMRNFENELKDGSLGIFKVKMADSGLDSSYELSFQNGVIENKPARILEDGKGGSAGVMYMFPSKNVLVIASNEGSIMEILSRLSIQ